MSVGQDVIDETFQYYAENKKQISDKARKFIEFIDPILRKYARLFRSYQNFAKFTLEYYYKLFYPFLEKLPENVLEDLKRQIINEIMSNPNQSIRDVLAEAVQKEVQRIEEQPQRRPQQGGARQQPQKTKTSEVANQRVSRSAKNQGKRGNEEKQQKSPGKTEEASGIEQESGEEGTEQEESGGEQEGVKGSRSKQKEEVEEEVSESEGKQSEAGEEGEESESGEGQSSEETQLSSSEEGKQQEEGEGGEGEGAETEEGGRRGEAESEQEGGEETGSGQESEAGEGQNGGESGEGGGEIAESESAAEEQTGSRSKGKRGQQGGKGQQQSGSGGEEGAEFGEESGEEGNQQEGVGKHKKRSSRGQESEAGEESGSAPEETQLSSSEEGTEQESGEQGSGQGFGEEGEQGQESETTGKQKGKKREATKTGGGAESESGEGQSSEETQEGGEEGAETEEGGQGSEAEGTAAEGEVGQPSEQGVRSSTGSGQRSEESEAGEEQNGGESGEGGESGGAESVTEEQTGSSGAMAGGEQLGSQQGELSLEEGGPGYAHGGDLPPLSSQEINSILQTLSQLRDTVKQLGNYDSYSDAIDEKTFNDPEVLEHQKEKEIENLYDMANNTLKLLKDLNISEGEQNKILQELATQYSEIRSLLGKIATKYKGLLDFVRNKGESEVESRHGAGKGPSATMGDDLSRLFTKEYAKLSNPIQQKMFMLDYLNGGLSIHKSEEKKQGDFLFVIDSSGSMQGNKIATALAIPLVTHKKYKGKRNILVETFSEKPSPIFNIKNIANVLKSMVFGGTDIGSAVLYALGNIDKPDSDYDRKVRESLKKIRTIILLTDGEDEIPDKTARQINTLKKKNKLELLCYGIDIGGRGLDTLKKICNEVYAVGSDNFGNIVLKRLVH
ncbi:von Willebrand domain A (VWA)-containing cochaperone protein [Acidianus two-tailed virus 2]|nr:von Willebrand domain A (VWA)-containing cochaperone protein [Acidianus two-tailed virus 2]